MTDENEANNTEQRTRRTDAPPPPTANWLLRFSNNNNNQARATTLLFCGDTDALHLHYSLELARVHENILPHFCGRILLERIDEHE